MARRLAFSTDATAGGTTFDSGGLGTTALAAATTTIPTTTFSVDDGSDPYTGTREMLGTRASVTPQAFRLKPAATADGRAYLPVLKHLLTQALPTTSTTGSSGVGYTHIFQPPLVTDVYLPAVNLHALTENDDAGAVVQRAQTGATINQLTFTAGVDDAATWSANWMANYYADNTRTPVALPAMPAYSTAYLGSLPYQELFLRDCVILENGSSTGSLGVTAFSVQLGPQLQDQRFDAGINRQDITLNSIVSRVWWPNRARLAAESPVTGTLGFRDQNGSREAQAALARGGVLVATFTLPGTIAGTSPAAAPTLRWTFYNAVQAGGPGALDSTSPIASQMTFGAVADAAGLVVKAEILDGAAGPVVLP